MTEKDLPQFKEDETNKKIEKEDQQTTKTSRQTEKRIKPKKGKWKQNLIFLLVFGLTAVFMYWTNQVSTPENATLIMFITLSVLVNITIILLLLGTGIGIELVKRFLNKFK